MNNSKFLADQQTIYRDCVIVPLLYTANGNQGYGFVTIYIGNVVSAHCCRPDQWLNSIEGALDVGRAVVDLDYLKLKHCIAELMR